MDYDQTADHRYEQSHDPKAYEGYSNNASLKYTNVCLCSGTQTLVTTPTLKQVH